MNGLIVLLQTDHQAEFDMHNFEKRLHAVV